MGTYSESDRAAIRKIYAELGCDGIASFLDFMEEIDENEQEGVLRLMLKTRLGRTTRYSCPFHYFGNFLHTIQAEGKVVNAGTLLLDTICRDTVLLWESTDHSIQ